MFIARKLKKENICEYLLYMWQIEDLIRALGLNIDSVNERIIATYPVKNEAERKELYDWYESLIDMMRTEDVQISGHLQLNKNVIIDLNDFHALALKSGAIPAYNAKFFHILPLINQLRMKGEPGLSDIELCFSFLYGIMTLRMKKAAISPETQLTQTEISKFMVLLAKNYQAYKNGELDLE
ncbi:MAG: hypothetical protein H6Q20_2632 [Bacteroidetes bacterium]|jgi:hypothetical protein|nr:hypothetical protein [Bacteroidota bacterium]